MTFAILRVAPASISCVRLVCTCVAWLIYMCGMTHLYVWHDFLYACVWCGLFVCATWRIHTCVVTNLYECHGALLRVAWRIHMCDMTHSCVRRDLFIWQVLMVYCDDLVITCVTWFIHMCDMTHLYAHVCMCDMCDVIWPCSSCVRHDSCMHMWHVWCDLTHSCVWRDSFKCVTGLICMCTCDVTHSYVWHDSFMCVTWLIHMCDMTHLYLWNVSCGSCRVYVYSHVTYI